MRDGGGSDRLDAGDASRRDDDNGADAAVLPGSRGDSGASDDDDAGLDASASDAGDASAEGDASDGIDGGNINPGQGGIALPFEVTLVTSATPYGQTGDRPCALDSTSLRYVNAYQDDELVSDDVFRFVARDWSAPGDSTESNAISVWWSRFNSDGLNTGFICTTANEGSHALYSLVVYDGEAEPEDVWKAGCAWQLLRHQTDDGIRYEIRKSSNGGLVSTVHSNAVQGNRVRVGTLYDALFELVSPP